LRKRRKNEEGGEDKKEGGEGYEECMSE